MYVCVCVCVCTGERYVKVRENQHERRLLYKCYSGLGHSADHFNNCLFWKCAPFSKRCSVTGNNRPYGQRRGGWSTLEQSTMEGEQDEGRSREQHADRDAEWGGETPDFPKLAHRRARESCGTGQGWLSLSGLRWHGSVLLLRWDPEALGSRRHSAGGAWEALPRMPLDAGQGCGQCSAGLGWLCGRAALESAAAADHGRAGVVWPGGVSREGVGGQQAVHLSQLAHRSIGAARRAGACGLLLHRCVPDYSKDKSSFESKTT